MKTSLCRLLVHGLADAPSWVSTRMASRIDFKRCVRLLAVIPFLAFAHKGMAADFISVGDGVPPAMRVPTSATTSNSGIPQLSADPCINIPCLKAAETIYRDNSNRNTDSKLIEEEAKSLMVDVLLKQGVDGGVLGFQGLAAINNAYQWISSPGLSTLKALGLIGDVAGAGLGVFFTSSNIGLEPLPENLRQWHATHGTIFTEEEIRQQLSPDLGNIGGTETATVSTPTPRR